MSSFVVGTLACVAALLAAERRGLPFFAVLLKPLASLGFLGTAVTAGCLEWDAGKVLFVALVLSLVGDVALLGKNRSSFLFGLGAFLLAHLAFAISFWLRGTSNLGMGLVGLPLLMVIVAVSRWLLPHVKGVMKPAVIAYMTTIALMVGLAFGAWSAGAHEGIAAGAVLFLLSDIFVARERFVSKGFVNRAFGLPLYYVAQLMLAAFSGAPG